jgi:hypothetical protein
MDWWVQDMENIAAEKLHVSKMKQIPIESRVFFRDGIKELSDMLKSNS